MPAVKQQGFTLIELIVVIVITGIIAVTSTQFIVNTAKGFSATSMRDKRANTLRISLAKIEHQLHNSIKNSVRVRKSKHSQCIEMLPISASAFYLPNKSSRPSRQIKTISLNTNVIGKSPVLGSVAGSLANTIKQPPNKQSLYYSVLNNSVLAQRKILQSPVTELELAKPIAIQTPAKQGLVHFTSSAVSYCLEKDSLYRYTNYAMKEKQPDSASLPNKEPQRVLLNQNLLPASFFSIDKKAKLLKINLVSEVNLAEATEEVMLHQQWWLSDE